MGMIVFFGIVALVGILLVLLDFCAKANDPTPSLYYTGITAFGTLMVAVGAVGAGCVALLG